MTHHPKRKHAPAAYHPTPEAFCVASEAIADLIRRGVTPADVAEALGEPWPTASWFILLLILAEAWERLPGNMVTPHA